MQIELTPEIEEALLAEASAKGLTAADVTLRILAEYTQARSVTIGSSSESRSAALRIAGRADAPGAPRLNLPEGLSIREWLHLGHRY